MSILEITKTKGANLPHWRAAGAAYFVTFRLAGTLPSHLTKEREELRKEIIDTSKRSKRPLSPFELDELEELHFEELDHKRFDLKYCFLKDPPIAKILVEAFKHFAMERYQLFAWTIMPNHVHIVLRPYAGNNLSDIMHSLKRFTAREANKILS